MKNIFGLYFHGSRKYKKIALTFDDGPSYETEKILDLLKKYGVKATFFIWGKRIKGREKTIERIVNNGHEIGNHSYSHKRLWFKSKDFIEGDIKKCDEKLNEFGIKTNLFRFPGFKIGYNGWVVCKKMEKKIIFSDVISNDWKKLGVNYSTERILRKTKNGSIINLHDYLQGIGRNKEIIPLLEKVLPKLKKKYGFVTINELFKIS